MCLRILSTEIQDAAYVVKLPCHKMLIVTINRDSAVGIATG
jgi:hypothetical protein